MEENFEFKTIEPKTFRPENDGDSIMGYVKEKKENVGLRKSKLYRLDTKDSMVDVWGSSILDQRMMDVKEGEYMKITYRGRKPKVPGKEATKQDLKIFKVEVGTPKLSASVYSI